MMVRSALVWGRAGRCWGAVRGCKGVLGPTHTSPTPHLVSSCCERLTGVNEVADATGGGNGYLHAGNLSSSAFTWSRRRRWRGAEGLPLSGFCRHYCSDFPGSNRGVLEVKDDEAQQLEVVDRRGGTDGGQFYDTEHHYHYNIQDKDIGVRVNVGETVICELQRLFKIPREDALRMVRAEAFLLISDMAILQTLLYLKSLHISPEQLLRVPWILLQSVDTLRPKVQMVTEPHLFHTVSDGLGFCYLTLQQITKYQQSFVREVARFPSHPNRLYYMADRMEMPVAVVVEKVVKPRQVLKMDMARIDNIIDICYKYGVHMRDVVSDMWVFCHNAQVTEDRLRQAVEAGCVHPKPWICHSSTHVFERYMDRLRSRIEVLGEDGSVKEYVSERLGCPMNEVTATFQRNPGLGSVHVGLIKRKLDLLFAEGFTADDVRSCLRILQYSEGRTSNRIKELKSLGQSSFPISILCKRPKTYLNFVHRIKRARKMEEKEKEEEEGEEEGGYRKGGGGRRGG